MLENSIAYGKLIDLIMHLDDQIGSTNRNHFAAISALVPILAFLIKLELVNSWVFLLIGLLAVLLAYHWLNLDTRLNLQKKCWVELARKLESNNLDEPFVDNIYLYQKYYFNNLVEKDISLIDKALQSGNPQRFKQASIAALVAVFFVIIVSLPNIQTELAAKLA